ncbi:HWE histidine kinase domain-containing protein [Microvirga thermotolerans]|uniref:histidine kinase n=1 Tax=Microvirga thermotolerans TaxID=2651334 RepID=A0A5P9JZP1_9HYPH|nr:HWE histidine kinase domain-containing protein [Microvirga thermotolerans]QFU15404.1 GAF domain-containing protein [Microvirga thermotolerans]
MTLAMGLLGVIFIVVTFAYIAWEQRSRLIQRDEGDIQDSAFFLADHAARLLEVTDVTLRQTAALVEDESWYTIEPSRILWEQVRAIKQALPYIEDIWLNDAEGRLRLTSAGFPTPESNASDRDAFRAQVEVDRGLYVGEPIVGRVTGAPTFMVSRRLHYPNGSFRGVVSVTVSLAYFNDYWGRLRLPPKAQVNLVRAADGKVIVQYPAPGDGISFAPVSKAGFERAIAENPEEGIYTETAGPRERRGAYHRVGQLPLYVQVFIPADAYRRPWLEQVRIYGAFALFALLALLALMAVAARQFREQAANAALLEREVDLRTRELRMETAALEVLNRTGRALAAELDFGRIAQCVIDAGVELTGAQIGVFFYHVSAHRQAAGGEGDEVSMPYAVSGELREAFSDVPMVRHTALFAPTLEDGRIVRSDDITADPARRRDETLGGLPEWHPSLRSYLAVPVVARTGAIEGALLFGHEQAGVFTARAERLVVGLAGQAAIALENSNLYKAAQYEIEERKQVQTQQSLLIRELHHRVKNTLATVQAVVGATARTTSSIEDFYAAFVGRIISLANTHSLLTEAVWQTASLREILEKELSPYNEASRDRVLIEGPPVELPSEAAVPIGMAIHELTTNAAKYGALSIASGRVAVRWESAVEPEGLRLKLSWTEEGGPPVEPPKRQGFGSRLLHRVLATQLNAAVQMDFEPTGLKVSIDTVLTPGGFINPSA